VNMCVYVHTHGDAYSRCAAECVWLAADLLICMPLDILGVCILALFIVGPLACANIICRAKQTHPTKSCTVALGFHKSLSCLNHS
jgi:hypothetical protein